MQRSMTMGEWLQMWGRIEGMASPEGEKEGSGPHNRRDLHLNMYFNM